MLSKLIFTLIMYLAASFTWAADERTQTNDYYVLIATFVTTTIGGGATGVAFQEFTSKDSCEIGIKVLAKLSEKMRGGFGTIDRKPVAECIRK